MESVVNFYRLHADAPPPLRGDKAALGTIPTAAFQYCEPMRTASSYGWYIFPPVDVRLRWNGVDIFYADDDGWRQLTSIHLTDEFVDHWDAHSPDELKGYWPPFMTAVSVPGIVQIWSGFLISTGADWSSMVGPIPNLAQTRQFSCFEGIIETDVFRPCPLFINLRLQATDQDIYIPRDKPLFFVRPVKRDCYSEATLTPIVHEGAGSMKPEDWAGYRETVRKIDVPHDEYKPGRYATAQRKRSKRGAD